MIKENKQTTRTLSAFYSNASIEVKKSIWKRKRHIKPISSSVVWSKGWYTIYLTFEKYGEHSYKAVDSGTWIEISYEADKFFSTFLKRVM